MSSDTRLDSWKAIAAYLGRTTRTVQRWEREEGLPIHRHVHQSLSSVFADTHEIDAWCRSRLFRQPLGAESGVDPVVGRDEEIAWLDSQLAVSTTQGARLACVTGEPGIGKTALVEEFRRRHLEASGSVWLFASCSERLSGADPYLPFSDAIRRGTIELLASRFAVSLTDLDLSTARAVIEDQRALVRSANNAAMLAEIEVNMTYLTTNDVPVSVSHLLRAVQLLRAQGDVPRSMGRHSLLAEVQFHGSMLLVLNGSIAQGLEMFAHGQEIANTDKNPFCRLYESAFGAAAFWLIGDSTTSLQHATVGLQRSKASNTWVFVNWLRAIVGAARCAIGDHNGGLQFLQQAAAGPDFKMMRTMVLTQYAEGCLHAGERELGLEVSAQALAVSAVPYAPCDAECRRLRALLLHKVGRRAEADRTVQQALAVARHQRASLLELKGATTAVEIARRADLARAREQLARVLVPFEREPEVPVVAAARRVLAAHA